MTIPLCPFFSYYGSKWAIAKLYPQPLHPTIIEPFCGSAGYSHHYYDRQVKLYDKDPVVCGVWDYLIHVSADEISWLPSIVQSVDDLPGWVPQECRWLIGFWLNRGSSIPKKTASNWSVNHTDKGQLYWGERAKSRLISQVDKIKHWEINCLPFDDLEIGVDSTWFVDPPYQVGGKHYRMDLSSLQYKILSYWCKSLPGQVIVCERTGATWLPFDHIKTARSSSKIFTKEAVWIK